MFHLCNLFDYMAISNEKSWVGFMSDLEVVCKNCSHRFTLEFRLVEKTIRCPKCSVIGIFSSRPSDFECYPTWSSGYEISYDSFKELLKLGGKYSLKAFFKRYLGLSFTRRKSGAISFSDKSNKVVSVEEVYNLIQKDWLLQRWIYNINFATFR